MVIKHIKTIIYYDGPQLFVAQDKVRTNFLCLLVEWCCDCGTYLCVQVSEHRLTSFLNGTEDLLSIYQEPETGEFYCANIDNLNIDIGAELIVRDDIPQNWFPGASAKLNIF